MFIRPAVVQRVVALAAAAVLAGCAAKPKPAANVPAQLQTLDQLPPLAMPEAATQPNEPAPTEALQRYAQGRDALLQNKKTQAQKLLNSSLELDPSSAVAHHDLAYAYLGLDNAKAEAQFRLAIGYDPLDADSRVQLARLLVSAKKNAAAIEQLRLARQSPDFDDDTSLAALNDLILGRLLQNNHPAAALQCYEHVIALFDNGKIQLRGRPELAELLRQPDILVIQAGDLALLSDQFEKAAAFYERVKQNNPQAASVLEMRIATAELAAGHATEATKRALAIVQTSHASFSSVRSYIRLFDQFGGLAEALKQLDALPPSEGDAASARHVLRSILLLRQGEIDLSQREIDLASNFDLAAVRQTVHAYRAGQLSLNKALIHKLLARTMDQPQQWPAITRGWAILSQPGQPSPLSPKDVESIAYASGSNGMLAVVSFVMSQLHLEQGEPVTARDLLTKAQHFDSKLINALLAGSSVPLVPNDAFDDASGLADLLLDDSDDPELLTALAGQLLQQGQKAILFEALHTANSRQPANVVIAAQYAQALAADEQRTEAITVLDHAQAVKSAGELYYLSSTYSGLNDNDSAEKVLRAALKIDPNNASVCNDLGYMLIDLGRDLDFAGPLVQTAVSQHPHNAAFLDSQGWFYYKQSQFDSAVGILQSALDASDMPDPGVLDHLGDAQYRAKHPDLAARSWNAAIEAISKRGSSDSQLRLRLENKLRQAAAKQAVDLAPLAIQK